MKKILIIIYILFIPLVAFSQEKTKKVNYKNEFFKDSFRVLKSDQTTKHGPFERMLDSKTPLVIGQYEHGQRIGIWKYYDFSGELIQEYDFDKQELIFHKEEEMHSTKAFRVKTDSFNIQTTLDRIVLPIGGYIALQNYFFYQLRYPPAAYQRNIEGEVVVAFTVDEEGNTSNFRIKNSLGQSCDREALRLLKNFKGGWIPAIYKGELIAAEAEITVKFLTGFKQTHPMVFDYE